METSISFKVFMLTVAVIILKVEGINVDGNPFKDAVESKHYIDKTNLIKYFHRLKHPVLYTAPRMFGKTVNLFMFRTFYEINTDQNGTPVDKNSTQNHETFLKLINREKISETILEDDRFFYSQFGSLPVLHYSFENLTVSNINEFLKSFKAMTSRIYKEHNYLLNSDRLNSTEKKVVESYLDPWQISESKLMTSGRVLSSLLSKHFDKACFILVDDFDAPVLKVITTGSQDEKDIFALLMKFSRDLMVENPAMIRGFLTGNTRLVKVYTPENVVHWQFTESEFMTPYVGFTEKEVEFLNRDTDIFLKDIRRYYDGYRGQNTSQWVYNPYSITKLLETHKMDVYWSAAVPLDILSALYKQHAPLRDLISTGCSLEEIKLERPLHALKCEEEITALKQMFKTPSTFQMNVLVEFLYELGYFTDKTNSRSAEDRNYILITPNKEIGDIFTQFVKKIAQN